MDFLRQGILASLSLYKRFVSPLLPPSCRFFPTCSQYSVQAIRKYGVCRGSALSIRRLCKCHPFHAGGYDPLA